MLSLGPGRQKKISCELLRGAAIARTSSQLFRSWTSRSLTSYPTLSENEHEINAKITSPLETCRLHQALRSNACFTNKYPPLGVWVGRARFTRATAAVHRTLLFSISLAFSERLTIFIHFPSLSHHSLPAPPMALPQSPLFRHEDYYISKTRWASARPNPTREDLTGIKRMLLKQNTVSIDS